MRSNNKRPAKLPPQAMFRNIKRAVKMLYKSYPVLFPIAIACIVFSAVTSAIPALFNQQIIAAIEEWCVSGDWEGAKAVILPKIILLGCFYVVSIICITAQTQLMAYMTQGFLCKMRRKLFGSMQDLPIKYFDTHKHGDIMSHYTNDIDTLRQLVSQIDVFQYTQQL